LTSLVAASQNGLRSMELNLRKRSLAIIWMFLSKLLADRQSQLTILQLAMFSFFLSP